MNMHVTELSFYAQVQDGLGVGQPLAWLRIQGGHLVLETAEGVDLQHLVRGNHMRQVRNLERVEAAQLERLATEHLKESCLGVGHTYLPQAVHTFMPWEGAGDCPSSQEHPLLASNNLCSPAVGALQEEDRG